jgi:hypothetical protein
MKKFIFRVLKVKKESYPELNTDPDPHHNVTDPQHCLGLKRNIFLFRLTIIFTQIGVSIFTALNSALMRHVERADSRR